MIRSNIQIIEKGINKQLSTHLNSNEIDCECNQCFHTPIDWNLVESFETLRKAVSLRLKKDTPLLVSSGHRCMLHNREVKGASPLSMHMVAAMDIICPNEMDVEEFAILAKQSGFTFVQRYFDIPRIHVDNRGK